MLNNTIENTGSKSGIQYQPDVQAVADANRELSAGDPHHHHHADTREDAGAADTEEAAR